MIDKILEWQTERFLGLETHRVRRIFLIYGLTLGALGTGRPGRGSARAAASGHR